MLPLQQERWEREQRENERKMKKKEKGILVQRIQNPIQSRSYLIIISQQIYNLCALKKLLFIFNYKITILF